mmetsp:Transcript_65413/g.206717  ORF Transcript_65413/g.206717 Transcript_65413/m.206717 type:complete len:90 (+) Transcript_65413:75-344(+)
MSVMNQDMEALKNYVTCGGQQDWKHGQAQAESTVILTVTHSNLKMSFLELRFDRHVSHSPPTPAPPGTGPGLPPAVAGALAPVRRGLGS